MQFQIVLYLLKQDQKSPAFELVHSVFRASPMIEKTWFRATDETPEFLFLIPSKNPDRTHQETVEELKRLIQKADPQRRIIDQFEFQEISD